MIMTLPINESSIGPPPPVIELTLEQQFKLRKIDDYLAMASKEDIVTVFVALQRQNFALSNTVTNLVKKWPIHPSTTPEETSKSGTSSETKD
jgi:hypothetical protein